MSPLDENKLMYKGVVNKHNKLIDNELITILSFNIVHSLVHIITSLHSKFHFIIYRNKKVLVCFACSIVSAITVYFQDYM